MQIARVRSSHGRLLVIQSLRYERKIRVAVCGIVFRNMNIRNMVHQGTVLGLPLWNVYYAEVVQAVNLI